MSTREETIFENRKQRAMPRPIGAPDIRAQTRMSQHAQVQDKINSEKALTDPNHKTFSRKIGIGTRATYSTLPANSGKLNQANEFEALGQEGDPMPSTPFLLLDYVVPSGRVLYITSYDVYLTGGSPLDNPGNTTIIPVGIVSLTIKVDGSADPWNQNIMCQSIGGENPTHIIAGAKQRVQMWAKFEGGGYSGFDALYGIALIRGDMLIGNDNAAPYTALLKDDGKPNHE
jgi:hypothetical protein